MLDDAEPRPRRVAVGEFDGVHLGHREVISGSDTVLTFEPHPLQVVRPEAAPKLLTSLDAKAELIAELGVEELVVIPFDEGFAHQSPQEFIDHVLVERLRRDARLGRRELPLRPPRRGRPRAARRPTSASRRGSCRSSRSTARSSPRATSARSCSPARSMLAARFLGAPVPDPRRGRRPATGGAASSASRPPTSSPTRRSSAPATASTRPAPTAPARRSASACGRRSGPAGRCSSRPSCSIATSTSTARCCGSSSSARLRGERRFDSVEALIEQMHRDVERTRGAVR